MRAEPRATDRHGEEALGALIVAGAAFAYGLTIVFNRSLAGDGLGVSTVLGIRFGSAALVLFAVLATGRRPLLSAPGERWRVFLLGFVGYGIESTFFFMGLERGTAAAVALLFYSFPAMVTLVEIPLGAGWPSARAAVALGLTALGTVVVVASGSEVTISNTGIASALAAAFSFALYLLVSDRVIARTDALTTGAWVAAGASLSLFARGIVAGDLESPADHWPALLGNGAATAAAFALMFAGLKRLGPARTSVVMTLEAFFAILLAAVFLDEPLGRLQLVGGTSILAGAVLIGTAGGRAATKKEPP